MSRPELRKLIRKACEKHELSIVALAREAGVTRNTIYNWEGGITAPALDELSKVAKRLELPLSALVDAWDGKTQKEAAPDLPERLNEIENLMRAIASVSGIDLKRVDAMQRELHEAQQGQRPAGARKPNDPNPLDE